MIMDNYKPPIEVISNFITYNFYITPIEWRIIKDIISEMFPPGIVIEIKLFFNLFVEICKQILVQKYSEIRDPYTGEPIK